MTVREERENSFGQHMKANQIILLPRRLVLIVAVLMLLCLPLADCDLTYPPEQTQDAAIAQYNAQRDVLRKKELFSCQGGPKNCDDGGAQSLSSGGNVTMRIEFAQGIKNMDPESGGPAGGVSDPFVRISWSAPSSRASDSVEESASADTPLSSTVDMVIDSKVVRNELDKAVFDQDLNLGIILSGTALKVELWDHDIGFFSFQGDDEDGNDLIYSSEINVPYCSQFGWEKKFGSVSGYRQKDCKRAPDGKAAIEVSESYESDADDIPDYANLANRNTFRQQYGCESDESLWHSGLRQQCVESGWVNFKPEDPDDPAGYVGKEECQNPNKPCLKITFIITPFVVETVNRDMRATHQLGMSVFGKAGQPNWVPVYNVEGSDFPEYGFTVPWALQWREGTGHMSDSIGRYQFLYTDDSVEQGVTENTVSKIVGGVLVQTALSDKDLLPSSGNIKDPIFWLATNFPATVWVCQSKRDPLLHWVVDEGYDLSESIAVTIDIGKPQDNFGCYYKVYPGTVKNKWHGTESGAIPFYSNAKSSKSDMNYNYVVVITPVVERKPELIPDVSYDSVAFMNVFFRHGWLTLIFIFFSRRYAKAKLNYHFERVDVDIVSRKLFGPDKTILATLLRCKDCSPLNVQFRAHVYWATRITHFLVGLPLLLIYTWGSELVYVAQPVGVGYFVLYIGMAWFLGSLGIRCWEAKEWRMNKFVLVSLGLSMLFVMLFLSSVVFNDPAVIQLGLKVDFAALSVIFGTVECFILLNFVFRQNRFYMERLVRLLKHLTSVADPDLYERYQEWESEQALKQAAAAAAVDLENGKGLGQGNALVVAPAASGAGASAVLQTTNDNSSNTVTRKPMLSINRIVHKALGFKYTLHPKNPFFRLSTVLDESLGYQDASSGTFWDSYYLTSVFVRFVYLLTALSNTKMGGVAFQNCCCLFVFDYIHDRLEYGGNDWSPYVKVVLMIVGRVTIMSSSGDRWLLTYSLAYVAYSFALSTAIMEDMFPMPTLREMEECAFSGRDFKTRPAQRDISGTPGYCFIILTFLYSVLNLSAALSGLTWRVHVEIFGSSWQLYVIGVISVAAVFTIAIVQATLRCRELERRKSLEPWMKEIFFLSPRINLPIILGGLSASVLIFLGAVIYATTNSAIILVFAIYVPPITVCLGYSYKVWVENDYDLVVWPRPEDVVVIEEVAAFQEEEEEEEEGQEEEIEKVTATLANFEVPKLAVSDHDADTTSVKMPALPLKSALRAKRAKLGIVAKKVLVKDLRGREGGDNEKFGGADADVIDINDPFAAYRDSDSEDEDRFVEMEIIDPITGEPSKVNRRLPKVVKAKSGMNVIEVEESIWDNPTVKMVTDALKKAKEIIVPIVIKAMREFGAFCQTLSDRLYKVLTDDHSGDEHEDELDENGVPKQNGTPFFDALLDGKLNFNERLALASWFGGLFLIMLMGITLGATVEPRHWGHLLWYGTIMFLVTAVPVVKYFNTYRVDSTIKQFMFFGVIYHFIFCIAYYTGELNEIPGQAASLWLLDYFFYYPMFVFLFVELYKWRDSDWKIEPMDKDGDGKITKWELLMYFKVYPIALVMMIILNVQVYGWIGRFEGLIFTLLLLLCAIMYFFVRDWATNDFYVSPELSRYGSALLVLTRYITAFIILNPFDSFSTQDIMITITIFLATTSAQSFQVISQIRAEANADSTYFVGRFIMPLYCYNTLTNEMELQKPLVIAVTKIVINVIIWCMALSIFYYPLYWGVSITCYCILFVAAVCTAGNQFISSRLLPIETMITEQLVKEAANAASEASDVRCQPFTLEIIGYKNDDRPSQDMTTPLDELKKRSALVLSKDIKAAEIKRYFVQSVKLQVEDDEEESVTSAGSKRAKHRKKGGLLNRKNAKIEDKKKDDDEKKDAEKEEEEEEERGPPLYLRLWWSLKDNTIKLIIDTLTWLELLPPPGYEPHGEGLFSWADACAEIFISARGPLAFIGAEQKIYNFVMKALDTGRHLWLHPYFSWLRDYDEHGNYRKAMMLPEPLDHTRFLQEFVDRDRAIDFNFAEEYLTGAHFITMILVGAEAKFERERILFQKFLRSQRKQLAENGIHVPTYIFRSSSYASVDISAVAVWLLSLTTEERTRFHSMKAIFTHKGFKLDGKVDDDDYEFLYNADKLRRDRKEHEKGVVEKIKAEIVLRKEQRIDQWVSTLIRAEQMKFTKFRKLWSSGSDVYIDSLDQPLYDKFLESQKQTSDDISGYAFEKLQEIENVERDCVRGAYGRNFQFVDPDFPPNADSVGDVEEAGWVLGWRCAPGINRSTQLLEGGTSADDVEVGVFRNGWLLSAIMMLASIGEEGEDKIEVLNSFIARPDPATGGYTYNTRVGAYCVRLFKRGQWVPIILDDLFPMLLQDYWTDTNGGMAVAHSYQCRELWVSLIEKAFAKFYGSYSELNYGYVHHALEDLTGCDAEVIPLARQSRGVGKRHLWMELVRFRRNGYILGAGTGSSELVDKEILDMGIVFDACYIIFDVRLVNGLKLIKMRNPPGNHEEWKGDWSDKSALWTKRLKAKLDFVDADDNMFWMAFDDFCNVFRHLYVCKWLKPSKWRKVGTIGEWKLNTVLEYEQKKLLKEMMTESNEEEVDQEKEIRDLARAQIDTAGGMPTKHNPGCKVENNPHFTLIVHRPSEMKISLNQVDRSGMARADPLPAAIHICRLPPEAKLAQRIREITRENLVTRSGEAKAMYRNTMYTVLQPGTYMVLCTTYLAEQTGHFDLIVESNYKLTLEPFYPPRWMLKGGRDIKEEDTFSSSLQKSLLGVGASRKQNAVLRKAKRLVSDLFGSGNEEIEDSESSSDDDDDLEANTKR